MQLIPGFADTIAIVAVHHEDETLRVLEVVPPEGTDLPQPLLIVLLCSCACHSLSVSSELQADAKQQPVFTLTDAWVYS